MRASNARVGAASEARASDLDSIAALAQRCLGEAWSRQGFAAELQDPGSQIFVARASSGTVLAYLVCRQVGSELQILSLAVAPERRRQGLASNLLEHALSEGRGSGVEVAHLEQRASNSQAFRFYRRHGFVDVGRRPRYYGNREDAILMTLDFKPNPEVAG